MNNFTTLSCTKLQFIILAYCSQNSFLHNIGFSSESPATEYIACAAGSIV